jgi:hypothetical protein
MTEQAQESQEVQEGQEATSADAPTPEQQALEQAQIIIDRESGVEPVQESKAPEPVTEGQAEVATEDAAKSEEESKAEDVTQVEPADLEKARQVLKRDNYDDDIIDGLPPERVVEMAEKAKKRQDLQAREREEYLRYQQNTRKFAEENQSEGQSKEAEPVAGLDLSDVQEELGEQATKQLSDFVNSQKEQFKAEMAIQQESFDKKLSEMQAQHHESMFEAACDRLCASGQAPQLKDSSTRGRVHEQAARLSKIPDGYISDSGQINYESLAIDALALAMPKETINQTQQRIASRHKIEANGQPSASDIQPVPTASKTNEEKAIEAVKMLQKGDMTPEQVRAKLNSV